MLAARGEGVGSCLTRMLTGRPAEVADILGVPADEGWKMAACVTFGIPTGRWGVAERPPRGRGRVLEPRGAPLGFAVDGPLFP